MVANSNESEVNKSFSISTKTNDVEIITSPSATIVQLSPELIQFYDELQKALQPDQVDFSTSEREARGKPWNSYHHVDRDPSVVVFPQSTEDVSTILKLCLKYKVPGMSIELQLLSCKFYMHMPLPYTVHSFFILIIINEINS